MQPTTINFENTNPLTLNHCPKLPFSITPRELRTKTKPKQNNRLVTLALSPHNLEKRNHSNQRNHHMYTTRQAMKRANQMTVLCLKFHITAVKKFGKNKSLLNQSLCQEPHTFLFFLFPEFQCH